MNRKEETPSKELLKKSKNLEEYQFWNGVPKSLLLLSKDERKNFFTFWKKGYLIYVPPKMFTHEGWRLGCNRYQKMRCVNAPPSTILMVTQRTCSLLEPEE